MQSSNMKNKSTGLRILQVVRQFLPRPGGMQEYVAQLSRHLIDMGHQVHILTLNRNIHTGVRLPDEPLILYKDKEIFVKRIDFRGWSRFFWVKSFELFPEDYDVIHVHGLDGLLSASLRFSKAPLFLSTHGGFFHTSTFKFFKNIWFQTYVRIQLQSVCKVLACSRQDFFKFKKICNHVELLENGVDVDNFRPRAPRKIRLQDWLYVGGFQSNKRVHLLLKAFEYCCQYHSNLRLTVVGGEIYSGQWQDLTRGLSCKSALDHISYLSDDELVGAFHDNGIFVSAADFEGFGLASMEAMASGSLLILHPNQSFLDLFSGVAEFADFQRPEQVLQAYDLLLKMSEQALLQRATRGMAKSEVYSWQRVSRDIENHYLNAI